MEEKLKPPLCTVASVKKVTSQKMKNGPHKKVFAGVTWMVEG